MTRIILYFYINFLKKDIIRILKSSHPGILFIFSNRDISGLMEGGSYTPETKSWSDTLPCVTDGRQDTQQASLLGGRGECQLHSDVRLAHQLPGKATEGECPSLPQWSAQTIAGARGKCVGRSGLYAGCRGSRHSQDVQTARVVWLLTSLLHTLQDLTILVGPSSVISLASLQPDNTNTMQRATQAFLLLGPHSVSFSNFIFFFMWSVFGILKFPVIMKRSFYPISISKW